VVLVDEALGIDVFAGGGRCRTAVFGQTTAIVVDAIATDLVAMRVDTAVAVITVGPAKCGGLKTIVVEIGHTGTSDVGQVIAVGIDTVTAQLRRTRINAVVGVVAIVATKRWAAKAISVGIEKAA